MTINREHHINHAGIADPFADGDLNIQTTARPERQSVRDRSLAPFV
jgi:hypothetical protein